jgi:hypothetical protein
VLPGRFFLTGQSLQQRGQFFLDIDDDAGFAQVFGEASVLAAQFADFNVE